MPQQSLALANSELTLAQARVLAKTLAGHAMNDDEAFARAAFSRILARQATAEELAECVAFARTAATAKDGADAGSLREKARERLVLVLFNHHDFVTIR